VSFVTELLVEGFVSDVCDMTLSGGSALKCCARLGRTFRVSCCVD
jgi:hypothetical protein